MEKVVRNASLQVIISAPTIRLSEPSMTEIARIAADLGGTVLERTDAKQGTMASSLAVIALPGDHASAISQQMRKAAERLMGDLTSGLSVVVTSPVVRENVTETRTSAPLKAATL